MTLVPYQTYVSSHTILLRTGLYNNHHSFPPMMWFKEGIMSTKTAISIVVTVIVGIALLCINPSFIIFMETFHEEVMFVLVMLLVLLISERDASIAGKEIINL